MPMAANVSDHQRRSDMREWVGKRGANLLRLKEATKAERFER
jgi:hypothetical protein